MPATRKPTARKPKAPRLARPPHPPADRLPTEVFIIYHHGYKRRKPILQLRSNPSDPNGDLNDISNYALPYDLVLEACAVLANNERGTLYISSSTASLPLKAVSKSAMLKPGEYAYCLTGHQHGYRYPLCPKFTYWRPGDVPKSFLFDKRTSEKHDLRRPIATSAVSITVKVNDEVCALTGGRDRVDAAHLVPSSAARWFFDCRFSTQAGDSRNLTVNSPNNRLVLRTDINKQALDVGDFCFFPLPYEKKWVSIWMKAGSPDLAHEHNFREVTLPPRIRAAYLFGRFAWNIFLLAQKYLKPQAHTLHLVKNNNNDDGEEGDGDGEEDDDSGEEDGGGGGGGGSKRKRGGSGGEGGGKQKQGGGGGKGKGKDKGGGKRKRGGDEGEGGAGAAPTRVQPKKKRHAAAQLADRATKRPRLGAAPNDVPDLSPIDRSALQIMKHIDRRLQAGEIPYSQSSEWYPGFSRIAETAYNYKLSHPATTDPGGARIAFLSERDE